MHNLGNVWLADGKESKTTAPVVGSKQNKDCETANSKTLSGGKIANHTPAINFFDCQSYKQLLKQLQPPAFPSFILEKEKDDLLPYGKRSSLSISSQAGRR